jgi:hypothetical protein
MMEIVPVYEDKDGWRSNCGYAVVEEVSLYITERAEPKNEDDYRPEPIKWDATMGKVLFYTSADAYDGGYQVCEAFIKGYDKGLPVEPPKPTFVGSCA